MNLLILFFINPQIRSFFFSYRQEPNNTYYKNILNKIFQTIIDTILIEFYLLTFVTGKYVFLFLMNPIRNSIVKITDLQNEIPYIKVHLCR